MKNNTEIVVLGGGCFWCTEALFRMLRGVNSVTSGYAGGTLKNPTYEDVCTGLTGHAEVIKVEFNPDVIPYHDVLDFFGIFTIPQRSIVRVQIQELNIVQLF